MSTFKTYEEPLKSLTLLENYTIFLSDWTQYEIWNGFDYYFISHLILTGFALLLLFVFIFLYTSNYLFNRTLFLFHLDRYYRTYLKAGEKRSE